MAKNVQTRNSVTAMDIQRLDADELKSLVRDGLVSMNMLERENFIRGFEAEMKLAGLNIRAYLVPLGIPGRSPEDLTPNEVGHLIRYLKINVPKVVPAVARALSRYNIIGEKTKRPLAA